MSENHSASPAQATPAAGDAPAAQPTLHGKTALLAVDMQKGILSMPPEEVATELVTAVGKLAQAFHDAGLPVVWIHATGLPKGQTERPIPEPEQLPEDFADLDPRLPEAEGDIHIYKPKTWSAFIRTDLAEQLRGLGVSDVVVAGIATGGGVESTARNAYDEGFHVIAAADAMVDGNLVRHQQALAEDFPSIGQVSSVEAVLAAVSGR